jgi:phytoene dehydrogenase-like protein
MRTEPRCSQSRYDGIVVGAGPNGLAAAITLAREGLSVLVVEAAPTIGGGTRTAGLTLPGFLHDVCSAVHPFALASPFFRSLPLAEHGLKLIHPPAPLAHPLGDGRTAMLERSVEETGRTLERDATAYRRLMAPFIDRAAELFDDLIGPLKLPRHPMLAARFGLRAIQPATRLARSWFDDEPAKALFAGLAAHSILPLENWATSAIGLVLGLAGHAVGWPIVRGGSQNLGQSLASYVGSLGGEIVTGWRVESLDELPPARLVLLDVTPRQLVRIAGHRLPSSYVRRLERYRYGAGAFKLDWALSGPIPWTAPECARAGTVHLGGTLDELSASEAAVGRGEHPERPYVLLSQPSLFDPSRAPAGRQTAWAYCHVPNGSTVDMTDRIEAQVDRFAPGFLDLILARHVMSPAEFESYNANYIGGDINGGAQDLRQLFTRPVARLVPYSTPLPGLYICSSSTPPGGGVHGLCGYHGARAAMRRLGRGSGSEISPHVPSGG